MWRPGAWRRQAKLLVVSSSYSDWIKCHFRHASKAQVAEWQTHTVEGRVSERECEFESHLGHQYDGDSWFNAGGYLQSSTKRVRFPSSSLEENIIINGFPCLYMPEWWNGRHACLSSMSTRVGESSNLSSDTKFFVAEWRSLVVLAWFIFSLRY